MENCHKSSIVKKVQIAHGIFADQTEQVLMSYRRKNGHFARRIVCCREEKMTTK